MQKIKNRRELICVVISLLLIVTMIPVVGFSADNPVVQDFTKTETKNTAIYFTETDFTSNYTSDDPITTVKIVSLPQVENASLTLNDAPVTPDQEIPIADITTLMYTPKADYVGEDTFQYQAKGSGNYSDSATITIEYTEASEGSLVVENLSITTQKNKPVSAKLKGHSTDEPSAQPSFVIVDAPTKGKVDVTDVHTGDFTYTPFTDQVGDDQFTFRLELSPYESAIGTVTVTIEDTAPEPELFSYADLQNHWASYSAAMLVEHNITIGEKIGNKYYYRPDKALTRGDFTLLITSAIGLDSLPEYEGELRFADEAQMPQYLIEPAYRAMAAGIINGVERDGQIYFDADSTLTRIEAIVITNNAIDPEVASDVTLDYADTSEIPQWALQAVKNMEGYGLIKGYDDNTLRPYSLIIKSQGGEIVYQFFKYLQEYPDTITRLNQRAASVNAQTASTGFINTAAY